MSDILLFAALPYVALALFFLVTIARYRQRPYTYSSISSQFLENRQHFWSTVPFHYGILGVLAIHFMGLVIPDTLLWWNSVPVRLVIMEVTGLALGILALLGLINAIARRFSHARVNIVTTPTDWILYAMLVAQIVLGILVAVQHGWGSSWFASSASPWLWSLFTLQPDVSYVAALPLLVKLHIINAWIIVGFFPFTRLVHVLVVPNPYLWRRPQVVIWNRDRKTARIK
ncbi:MAG TPA: respiratory nitrate reductase subunit gamma [Planctomycetota bacterium]|jgi:nitrate reductase gamma subunit|nr:respiratory nitrate reductase subunit gamma [Planctomycetota bacterium]MDP6128575.1 respiratory nitrate reductase subunit gamma [Planctomycetota bacterium]MDP7245613.1 respiratory nitrate reductase subunit gamma [Planctomycetota bacterium]HJM39791.1 respiratory nitrate reductase subunit gamma [Planctomycetota bacterium]|tara:strand:+ start:7148 stop:7834 length:687 start_codon:yes stop_codon:yes gene_type:complete